MGLDVDLLSLQPKLMRFRHMLSSKARVAARHENEPQECALLRYLMFLAYFLSFCALRLEAVIYLGDTSAYVSSRPGSNATLRPWLRSQERGHLSFYFPEPPDFLLRVIERVGLATGLHPNNIEPIFHLYVPSAEPANLHLDNFNKPLGASWPFFLAHPAEVFVPTPIPLSVPLPGRLSRWRPANLQQVEW